MSGGALDYISYKLEDVISTIRKEGDTVEHQAFADHLELVKDALHEIEWVLSGDNSIGQDLKSIRKVISKKDILMKCIENANKAKADLESILGEL